METRKPFVHDLDGQVMTLIPFADQSVELPTYLLQGEKAHGYVYKNGNLEKWYWRGLTVVDGKRCLYFDPLELFPLEQITTTRRSQALSIVRTLAEALTGLDAKFLDLSNGILPLWRLWGLEGGGVLLFPQDLGDLFASCADEYERFEQIGAWVHHGIHPPFSLCDQLNSLLYYSVVGFAPFADKNTREDRFRALPTSLTKSSLDKRTEAFIDDTLAISLTRMRDIAGNLESHKALTWFLEMTNELVWNLEDRNKAPNREQLKARPECKAFLEGQEKRASRKVFWRKRGWIIITIVLSVGVVGWIATERITQSFEPPYTAGMEPIAIIEEYYKGMNSLDLQRMEASLAKKVKSPSSLEVTNLFVTRQARQAYEGYNAQVDPNTWIAEGKPAVVEGAFLYGITDLKIVNVATNVYKASGIMYTPYSYFDDTEMESDERTQTVSVYTSRFEQEFHVGMGERGWYEITYVGPANIEMLEVLVIPTFPRGQGIGQSR